MINAAVIIINRPLSLIVCCSCVKAEEYTAKFEEKMKPLWMCRFWMGGELQFIAERLLPSSISEGGPSGWVVPSSFAVRLILGLSHEPSLRTIIPNHSSVAVA